MPVTSASPVIRPGVAMAKVKDELDTGWFDELFGPEESPLVKLCVAKCLDQASTQEDFEKSTSFQCIHSELIDAVFIINTTVTSEI